MVTRDEALAELDNPDWSSATVVRERRPAKVVFSVRFPPEVSERLAIEADKRGMNPGKLVRELVTAGLVAEDQPILVRPSDLRRAITAAAVQPKAA